METERDIKDVWAMYGFDDNPIRYMIELRGEVRIVDKGHVTKPKDFESILDKYQTDD